MTPRAKSKRARELTARRRFERQIARAKPKPTGKPCGKVKHTDYGKAASALRSMQASGRSERYMYFCDRCVAWHTSSRGKHVA